MSKPRLVQATDSEQIEFARQLFKEYAAELGFDLCFQGFEQELESLPGKYSPPLGRLLLLMDGKQAIACGALRPFEKEIAEMKRFYVRPPFRGLGYGRKMAEWLIFAARTIGYRAICLDTHVSLLAARSLYLSLGFRETTPYYNNPLPNICYLRLDLTDRNGH